jgi:DNA gyrase subunit A
MAEDLENQENDKIIKINIDEQMKSAYIDYSDVGNRIQSTS